MGAHGILAAIDYQLDCVSGAQLVETPSDHAVAMKINEPPVSGSDLARFRVRIDFDDSPLQRSGMAFGPPAVSVLPAPELSLHRVEGIPYRDQNIGMRLIVARPAAD